jgi:hypothetical protein
MVAGRSGGKDGWKKWLEGWRQGREGNTAGWAGGGEDMAEKERKRGGEGKGGGINLVGDGGGKKWREGWRDKFGGREIRRCEREREKIWRENNGEKCQQISLVINVN